jgi:hypothetical protein
VYEQLQDVNDEQEQSQDINEDMVTDDNESLNNLSDNESQINEFSDNDFPNYFEYNGNDDNGDINDTISNLSVEGK